ncbi:MAG: permease [Anaerolineales bacterium]|nr:permease [Anaerolineales bacterium]
MTLAGLLDQLSIFSTIFLGIFIEAAPFLMLGTLASGLVEVFLNQNDFSRWVPRNPFAAALVGGLLGIVFPVCECGVVPLTRRLVRKGLPISASVAFLLSAPVFNLIVIASTLAAFGPGPVLFGRIGLSLLIAVATGAIFAFEKRPERLLLPQNLPVIAGASGSLEIPVQAIDRTPLPRKLRRVLGIAVDEFFEMGRYLVFGGLLAALMQTFIPQSSLLGVSTGPVVSVLVLIALAVLLSICSTVDAFIALAFTGTFTTGSILAFLVFGPMVDIKSTLMFLGVFKRRAVVYIVLLPLLMSILAGIFINLNTTW